MVEILMYETPEEAETALEQWREANAKAFKELEKSVNPSSLLRTQRYVFIAALAAYVDNNPAKYYYEAQHPFLGETNLYDDIASLVQGVKDAVKRQTPQNIETVLYTVENHEAENETVKRETETYSRYARMALYEDHADDPSESVPPKDIEEYVRALEEVGAAPVRGLSEQERQEFIRLYEEISA
ncbi:MAG: hypothetical protein Q8R53_02645 [Nanoarchaeota archaeon]|nr:hypothetical protein [Nanoarchaeota archaeon]